MKPENPLNFGKPSLVCFLMALSLVLSGGLFLSACSTQQPIDWSIPPPPPPPAPPLPPPPPPPPPPLPELRLLQAKQTISGGVDFSNKLKFEWSPPMDQWKPPLTKGDTTYELLRHKEEPQAVLPPMPAFPASLSALSLESIFSKKINNSASTRLFIKDQAKSYPAAAPLPIAPPQANHLSFYQLQAEIPTAIGPQTVKSNILGIKNLGSFALEKLETIILNHSKSGDVTQAPQYQAEDSFTYTIRVSWEEAEGADAYEILVTEQLPSGKPPRVLKKEKYPISILKDENPPGGKKIYYKHIYASSDLIHNGLTSCKETLGAPIAIAAPPPSPDPTVEASVIHSWEHTFQSKVKIENNALTGLKIFNTGDKLKLNPDATYGHTHTRQMTGQEKTLLTKYPLHFSVKAISRVDLSPLGIPASYSLEVQGEKPAGGPGGGTAGAPPSLILPANSEVGSTYTVTQDPPKTLYPVPTGYQNLIFIVQPDSTTKKIPDSATKFITHLVKTLNTEVITKAGVKGSVYRQASVTRVSDHKEWIPHPSTKIYILKDATRPGLNEVAAMTQQTLDSFNKIHSIEITNLDGAPHGTPRNYDEEITKHINHVEAQQYTIPVGHGLLTLQNLLTEIHQGNFNGMASFSGSVHPELPYFKGVIDSTGAHVIEKTSNPKLLNLVDVARPLSTQTHVFYLMQTQPHLTGHPQIAAIQGLIAQITAGGGPALTPHVHFIGLDSFDPKTEIRLGGGATLHHVPSQGEKAITNFIITLLKNTMPDPMEEWKNLAP